MRSPSSNVFATLNPQVPTGGGYHVNKSTFTFGANKVVTSTGHNFGGCTL